MKRLVLLGGGHAHVHVLDALRAQPRPDVEVTLVSPYPRQVYSGMLPGWIAGHYSLDECVLPLDRLAVDAQVRFVQQKGIGLDLAATTLLPGPRAEQLRFGQHGRHFSLVHSVSQPPLRLAARA